VTEERLQSFYRYMNALYDMSNSIKEYEGVPRKYGTDDLLYMAEVHTLELIGKKERTTTSELSQMTNKTLSAISQTVDKLAKKDLVMKTRNENNLRQIFIVLTEKGKKVYDFHEALDLENYLSYLEDMADVSEEEIANTAKVIRKTNEILQSRMKELV